MNPRTRRAALHAIAAIIIGELALYVAYLDAWTTRHKVWPWATALLGLIVSVAGNIGHIPATTSHPVPAVDRLTAATSPVAAFAGLAVALLVLKQTRLSPAQALPRRHAERPVPVSPEIEPGVHRFPAVTRTIPMQLRSKRPGAAARITADVSLPAGPRSESAVERSIVHDARALRTEYEERGARLTRRELATGLRARGHTLANSRLRELAKAIDLP